jgi:hypothetical protein
MSITVSTKSYNQDRITADAITYAGPANTLSVSDFLEIKRVYPKPVKGFAGVAKPQEKLTRTVTLDDGTTADAILTISGSLPVGMSDSDITALLTDGKDVLALEVAGTTSVFKKLDITY